MKKKVYLKPNTISTPFDVVLLSYSDFESSEEAKENCNVWEEDI